MIDHTLGDAPETDGAATEPPTIKQALAQFVSVSLPSVAGGLGCLYLLFTIAHYIVQPPAIQIPMTITALISSILLLLLSYFLRDRVFQTEWAHFWAAIIAGFVLVNSWRHMALTRDMLQSSNFMLLLVGIGFFFLSTRWLIGFGLITLVSWGAAIYAYHIPLEHLVHFIFGLVSASLLSWLAHGARRARLVYLSHLHHQDAEKAQKLQNALTSIQASEAALRSSEAQYRALSVRLEEQAEALRLANQALADASKAKDEFLASMSHELRTPLTAILGVTESLRENVYGPLSERQDRALYNVLDSGRHLLNLINDILDVAKTEVGQLELNIVPADVHMIVESTIRMLRPQADAKQLQFTVEIDPEVRLLLCDERRLKQILINLLNNAVKFTDAGGKVGLLLHGNQEDQTVEIAVWDTGIGIDDKQIGKLFKPFIQLDSRLARRYGGSGLGLVLAYRMTEMHGGSVRVESQLGEGSRFTVMLPWRRPHRHNGRLVHEEQVTVSAHGRPDGAIASHLPKPPLLLIIDDHKESQQWLAQVGTEAGYQPLVKGAVTDPKELLSTVQPTLILVDLQLPDTDALTLINTLVMGIKHETGAPVPVIALSALDRPQLADQVRAAGASAYLRKPVSAAALRQAAAQLLPEN